MKGLVRALLMVSLVSASPALAWDVHAPITRQTLLSFKYSGSPTWTQLSRVVKVTPLEEFLAKAFGADCSYETAKHAVFGGLGQDYRVLYTPSFSYSIQVQWEKGISKVLLRPGAESTAPDNPQALGKQVSAFDVLSIYSDEPDWNMDDDVPELKGKGVGQASEGTSTRLLRHFWYEGESELDVQFDRDQETDKRMQLYYELALVAFSVDEPYWGFRFLGNALHYLQDMTQPYHTEAVINPSMVDKIALVRAALCAARKGTDCATTTGTVDQQVIKSAWVVGAYHAAYEDFARGLLAPADRFQSALWLLDMQGAHARDEVVEELPWQDRAGGPLLDLRQVIRSAQQSINAFSESIGDLTYRAFGWRYRYDEAAARQQILASGTSSSLPYKIATLFGFWDFDLTSRQTNAVEPLVKETHHLFLRAGTWGREFVEKSLESLRDPEVLRSTEILRKEFQKKCERPPSL